VCVRARTRPPRGSLYGYAARHTHLLPQKAVPQHRSELGTAEGYMPRITVCVCCLKESVSVCVYCVYAHVRLRAHMCERACITVKHTDGGYGDAGVGRMVPGWSQTNMCTHAHTCADTQRAHTHIHSTHARTHTRTHTQPHACTCPARGCTP